MSLTAFNRVRRMKQEQEMKPENIAKKETENEDNNNTENRDENEDTNARRKRRN